MRGKLIVIEGLDKAGKSTQCALLVDNLRKQGHNVRHQRFPDRTTPIGQMINNYLTGQSEQEDHVIHLLFSANRWEAAASIEKDIQSGTTVIIDRYYYSGCVYSAAKKNPLLSLAWARHPEEGLPRPDVCIFLDISAEGAAKRGGYGEEKYESKQMQDRVRQLFAEMQQAPNDRDDFVKIDAGASLDEVEERVMKVVLDVCERVDSQNVSLKRCEPW